MEKASMVCALLAMVSLGAPPAHAQDAPPPDPTPAVDPDAEAVQALLANAVHEYDSRNYQEAYALFLRVHGMRPTARTQRALGKAAFELRHYREAVEWLEGSLSDQRSPLTDEMRSEVETLLTRARAFIGRFALRSTVEGAVIDVDGRPMEGSTVDLDLGEHEIVARAEGYEPLTRRVSVNGGEDETIELALVRAGTTTLVVAEDPGALYRDLGWASIAIGAGLVAGGVIATIIWADTVGTLNANVQAGACTSDVDENIVMGPAVCYDQESRYRLALPLAWAGYIAGAVFLATGLGLVFGAPTSSSAGGESARVVCGPFADGGVACGGEF